VTGHETPMEGGTVLAASSTPASTCSSPVSPARSTRASGFVHVSDSMAVMAQVERGEVKPGLVGRRSINLSRVPLLASDRMVLVVPPGHP